MDKDNFIFMLGEHQVVMTSGTLFIDYSEYEEETSPVEYKMARRIAYEEGLFPSDDGVEAVSWQVPL